MSTLLPSLIAALAGIFGAIVGGLASYSASALQVGSIRNKEEEERRRTERRTRAIFLGKAHQIHDALAPSTLGGESITLPLSLMEEYEASLQALVDDTSLLKGLRETQIMSVLNLLHAGVTAIRALRYFESPEHRQSSIKWTPKVYSKWALYAKSTIEALGGVPHVFSLELDDLKNE